MEDIRKIRSEYIKVLRKAEGKPLGSGADDLDLYKDICCGCVLIAEDNLREQRRYWENSLLAQTLLRYGEWLEGFDHMLDFLYEATRRMVDCIIEHPRLKLRLFELRLSILYRIEAQTNHDLSVTEQVINKIDLYRSNIGYADNGELDKVHDEGHLKNDPVEWTLAYENAIDDVERELDLILHDHRRGMGFCHAVWYHKAQVLEMQGIKWRSPGVMNPRVMFD